MSIIHVEGLTKTFKTKVKKEGLTESLKSLFSPTYKEVEAVKNISFSVEPGETVGFIGPNGAGKSTTIKMMTGILWPTSGTVEVLGLNPQEQRKKLAYDIGTVFGQRQQLWLHLPALDSFSLFQHMYDIDREEFIQRRDQLIEIFDVGDYAEKPVRKLSLGQRMRCELIASLLHNPKILFLDEPTIGIDIIAKKELREHIKTLNQTFDTTIILTSHDFDDIENICDRLLIINEGTIVFDGPTAELKKQLKEKIVTVRTSSEVDTSLHLEKVSPYQYLRVVDTTEEKISDVVTQLSEHVEVEDITVEEPKIDKVIETYFT